MAQMTREEILKLTGREFNAVVAERVMGWHAAVWPDHGWPGATPNTWLDAQNEPRWSIHRNSEGPGWSPSTEANAAREVLREMEKRNLRVRCLAAFKSLMERPEGWEWEWDLFVARPRDISVAALLAVEGV